MLLNEFLKEHRKVEAQQGRIDSQETAIGELKSIIAQQRKDFESQLVQQRHAIEVLTAGLENVSTHRYSRISAAKTVADDQPTTRRSNHEYESAN